MKKKDRCTARTITGAGRRCEKRADHVTSEYDVVHKAGGLTWREREVGRGQRASRGIFDEAFTTTLHFDGKPLNVDLHSLFRPLDAPEVAEVRFNSDGAAPPNPESQLTDWWLELATDEAARTVPKAVEYSATDLADIGHVLARTAGRTVSDEEAAELGVFFYLQGKLSRWAGAVAQGKRPSDDTIFDIGVYCRMAQRIRQFGNWPGVALDDGSIFHSMCTEPCDPNCSAPAAYPCNHIGGHLPHCEGDPRNEAAGTDELKHVCPVATNPSLSNADCTCKEIR